MLASTSLRQLSLSRSFIDASAIHRVMLQQLLTQRTTYACMPIGLTPTDEWHNKLLQEQIVEEMTSGLHIILALPLSEAFRWWM